MFCVFVNSSVLWIVGGVEGVNLLLFEEYEMLSKSFNLNIKINIFIRDMIIYEIFIKE